MTDTSSTAITHPTQLPFSVTTAALASPVLNGAFSDSHIPEEEDYTIKCICTYADDDGNTVFCDKCETWQHIECYYPGENVPDLHFCADCQPRSLDGKRATERQKRLREQPDGGDRKSKRPPSKSHKKKIKQPNATTEQANGWHKHERQDSAATGKDQPPPTKRPKTSHHASGSVTSLNGTPTLIDPRKRAFSNGQSYPSPTKSPQDHVTTSPIPTYTSDFLELYDRDEGKIMSDDGENFHTLSATTKLSAWQRDPHYLAEETDRHDVEQAFIQSDLPLERSAWPAVSLEEKTATDVEIDGKHPRWNLLRLRTDVRKSQLVGEIKGHVGHLTEYCQDPSNRWQELRHPEPFVFFHPSMPIYIDSRREGTQFRYLRRSCHPNVTLKTYATSDGQCHYCFVALHDLSAGTELTAQWYMDRFNQESKVDDIDRSCNWASRLLANFGDCACDKAERCHLAPLDRRRSVKNIEATTKSLARKRKNKSKQAISPLSTGQATNSRAGSENVRILDDDDQGDSRSISGSSGSKSQSRDNTPTNMGILDADPVLGSGLTAREKRKIAMAEKAFEKVAQGHHSQRKKKRTSGGSTLNTPSLGVSHQLEHSSSSMPNTPGVFGKSAYADAGTSNRYSGSPPPTSRLTNPRYRSNASPQKMSAPTTPSLYTPFHRPTYIDHAMQTESDETELSELPPLKRRKYSTPTQRLLKRVLEDRAKFDQQRSENGISKAPIIVSPIVPSPDQSRASEDVEMRDATASNMSPDQASPSIRTSSGSPESSKHAASGLPSLPLPSQAAHSYANIHPPNGQRLQLSTLPPVPSFSSPGASVTSASTASPMVNTPSMAQSPFSFGAGSNSYPGLSGGMVAPSPIKKKLSLGDYMSRRSNLTTTPTIERTQSQSLEITVSTAGSQEPLSSVFESVEEQQLPPSTTTKASESFKEEAAISGVDVPTIIDTPMKDEPPMEILSRTTSAPQYMPTTISSPVPPVRSLATPPGVISPEVASVLSTLNAMMPVPASHRAHSASSS